MISSLAAATAAYAVLVTGLALVGVGTGRRAPGVDAALGFLGALVVVQAVVDVVRQLGGQPAAQPGVHLAYLLVAVAVPPVALAVVAGDRGRWASVLVVAAALVVAVLLVRLETTWRHP